MSADAEYYLVPKTLFNGQTCRLQVDATGNLRVTSAGGTLPTGAATSANQTTQITAEQAILAKQPALGTAGTASANVITVQGIAAGVPLPISGSFTIPAFDYQVFTYVGSTNNVSTQVFKTGGSGGTTVATLTFTYIAAGAADNDKIASITKS